MNRKSLLVLSSAVLMPSCASILSKSEYPVSLTSSPENCKVTVKKNGLAVYQGTTPSMVTLSASNGFFKPASYQVEFSKKGGVTQTVPLTADIDGWYLGNILFGGLIGILIIDPATGAMWKLPANVNCALPTMASVTGDNGKTLKIVEKNSLPPSIQKQLISLR